MKILDIKGTSSQIKFILDNNDIIIADGELQDNGFFAYKSSMKLLSKQGEMSINPQKKEEFIIYMKEFLRDKEFTVNFFE